MGKKKLTLEFVRSSFEKEGYRLLVRTPIDCSSKLNYICPKGHKHHTKWSYWQNEHRCPYCDGQGKPDIKYIRLFFESEGYELLSNEYINDADKLWYKCPNGHIYDMRWGNFRNGKRCPTCAIRINALNKTGDRC